MTRAQFTGKIAVVTGAASGEASDRAGGGRRIRRLSVRRERGRDHRRDADDGFGLDGEIGTARAKTWRGRKTVRADRRLRADEKRIRAQSTILYESHPKPASLLSITVFSARMRFSSARKTRLARAARNGRQSTSADIGGCLKLL
jgi:hypothetical protein